MQEPPQLGAIVLAGGRSRRMGAPKALLDWHGGTLVRRITGILQRIADPVVVVHADGQELPRWWASSARPIGHLIAARWRASPPDCGPSRAAVRPCSSRAPTCRFCTPTWCWRWRQGVANTTWRCRSPTVTFTTSARSTARICCLRVEQQLAGDRLRVGRLLEGIDVLRLDATTLPHPESLRNLNTDEEYRQALAEPQPLITLRTGLGRDPFGQRRWARPPVSPRHWPLDCPAAR